MKQLLSALMYCHNNGVCHRDLKPENCLYILPEENSEIKVIDFGLSATITEDDLLHDLTGTPYYIAPEMLSGNYSLSVDCWSLGVMMYLMLSGVPPFNGKDNNEILMNVYNGSFTFRPKVFSSVSDQAKDLVVRLLTKDPSLRLTASQAYSHPWVQGAVPRYNELPESLLRSIQNFMKTTSIKKASLMFIASKLSENDISKIRGHFKQIDVNGDGVITKDELVGGIQFMSNFPKENMDMVVSSLDVNDNGVVDYTEFLTGCLLRKSFSNSGYVESAFKHFDKDDSGFITANEIREALCAGDIIHGLSTHEIEAMIGEIDKNKDGCIDYREFIEMMNQRSLL
jgi:calcium-dependent protein kinase